MKRFILGSLATTAIASFGLTAVSADQIQPPQSQTSHVSDGLAEGPRYGPYNDQDWANRVLRECLNLGWSKYSYVEYNFSNGKWYVQTYYP